MNPTPNESELRPLQEELLAGARMKLQDAAKAYVHAMTYPESVEKLQVLYEDALYFAEVSRTPAPQPDVEAVKFMSFDVAVSGDRHTIKVPVRIENGLEILLPEAHEQINYAKGLLMSQAELRAKLELCKEALESYATCSDGCTCGDGWSHNPAKETLTALEQSQGRESPVQLCWLPIETLDASQMQFVLAYDSREDLARMILWNPYKKHWENPEPIGTQSPLNPTHWMPIPSFSHQNQQPKERTCEWVRDEHNRLLSQCGGINMTAPTPYKYCPSCGGKIVCKENAR